MVVGGLAGGVAVGAMLGKGSGPWPARRGWAAGTDGASGGKLPPRACRAAGRKPRAAWQATRRSRGQQEPESRKDASGMQGGRVLAQQVVGQVSATFVQHGRQFYADVNGKCPRFRSRSPVKLKGLTWIAERKSHTDGALAR